MNKPQEQEPDYDVCRHGGEAGRCRLCLIEQDPDRILERLKERRRGE